MAIPKDYSCEGQLNIWDYLSQDKENVCEIKENVCEHSGHKCNCEELWKVAKMDGINCNECCCIGCGIELCGARCNGSQEPSHHFPQIDPDIQSGKRKPYEYDFCRAKGMLVDFYDDLGAFRVGKITEWDDYYTTVEIDGEEYVGTSLNTKYHEGQLPSLDESLNIVKEKFGLWLTPVATDYLNHGWEYESKFKHSKITIYEGYYSESIFGGRRYISVSWDSSTEGTSFPCDTLNQVLKRVELGIKRAKELEEDYAERKLQKKQSSNEV